MTINRENDSCVLWSELSEFHSEHINGGFYSPSINVNVNIATISTVQTNIATIVARIGGNLNLNQYNTSINALR
jgi:hypothetical protein